MSRAVAPGLCFLLLAPAAARADGFDVSIFRPAPSTTGYFSQESARILPHLGLNLVLGADLGHDLLLARDRLTGKTLPDGGIIEDRLTGHVSAAIGLFGIGEIGVRMPLVLYQQGSLATVEPDGTLATTVPGDLAIHAKAHLVGGPRGFQFALAAVASVPTGQPADFAGGSTAAVEPRLLVGYEDEDLSATLGAGYRARGSTEVDMLEIDDEIAAGLGFAFTAVPGRSWVLLEGYVSRGVQAHGAQRETPAEALLGFRARIAGPFAVQLGAGTGLTRGYGTPAARGVIALAYAPNLVPAPVDTGPKDTDRDGILDPSDRCPTDPEDHDTFEDEDGCPDPDNDGDGVLDADDRCPKEAGPKENRGCPDRDSDGDGVVDRLDGCPEAKEDRDGFEDEDGCPEDDNDKDGVIDVLDKCPNDPEDVDGFQDPDGCPDPDNDKDGFLDPADKCPNQAEVFNGIDDDDGCPDKGKELAVLRAEKIEIREQVHFDLDKATIRPDSDKLLAAVAKIMILHPEIAKIRIEGHTDSTGTHAHNMKLSQDRADSVREHLMVKNGIDGGRLGARGFGPDHPVADNKSSKGRALNRRSEFIIEERREITGTPAAPPEPLPPTDPPPPVDPPEAKP